jgi:hypothetical protein
MLFFPLFDDFILKKSKIHIFSLFFEYFSTKNTLKLFKSNRNRLNSTRNFEWCINFQVLMKKYFGPFFALGGPLPKKSKKIIFGDALLFIHLKHKA